MKKPSRKRPNKATKPAKARLKPVPAQGAGGAVSRAATSRSPGGPGGHRRPRAAHEPTRLTGFAAFLEGLNGTPPKREPRPPREHRPNAARTLIAVAPDDRQALALLSLPILLLISAFALTQAVKPGRRGSDLATAASPAALESENRQALPVLRPTSPVIPAAPVAPATEIAAVPPTPVGSSGEPTVLSRSAWVEATTPASPPGTTGIRAPSMPRETALQSPVPLREAALLPASPHAAMPQPSNEPLRELVEGHGPELPAFAVPAAEIAHVPPSPPAASAALPQPIAAADAPPAPLSPALVGNVSAGNIVTATPMTSTNPRLALLAPSTSLPGENVTSIFREPALVAREPETGPAVCLAAPPRVAPARPLLASLTPAAFGRALATAARDQTADLVIYNDKYRKIAYPMGDVQPLYGVCTDVVIRAYRALGIDLQQRVHESSVGGGDPSIEHRRTETLRRFFARYGEQLPPSTIAEDFRPGDVVTYNRPQNRHSRSHIALVSDVLAPSGRYMIVHNRGWGPQLEDGLFVDEITGHYRYRGDPGAALVTDATLVDATPVPSKRPSALAQEHDRAAQKNACGAGLASVGCLRNAEVGRARSEGAPVRGLGR